MYTILRDHFARRQLYPPEILPRIQDLSKENVAAFCSEGQYFLTLVELLFDIASEILPLSR